MKLFLLTSILTIWISSSELELMISSGKILMKKVHHKNCLVTEYKDWKDNYDLYSYDLEAEIKGKRLGYEKVSFKKSEDTKLMTQKSLVNIAYTTQRELSFAVFLQ